MARQKMTAEQLKAFDWAALLAKLPALAAVLAQLLKIFTDNPTPSPAKAVQDCCQELKDLCDKECDDLANLILSYCALHNAIHGCDDK